MSKLIEKLYKVGQHPASPLGFGAAKREAPTPHIILLGQTSIGDLSKNPNSVEAKVDAILISMGSAGDGLTDKITESLKDRIWGVKVGEISAEQSGKLKEQGCDFIVFDAEKTSAGVLNDEDLGMVITVTADLDEDEAHALHGLSVDAAMFAPETKVMPLTVRKLIEIQKVRGLIGKPFIMACSLDLGQPELESFRNADINGLAVDLSSSDEIAKTKEIIDKLPRPKPRSGPSDIVPYVTTGFRASAPPPEEEEDDGDDDF